MNYQTVIDFWFDPAQQPHWFKQSDALDNLIREQFAHTLQQAAACELFTWRETTLGRLAEIIVLDQFSRNIYRGTPQAFAQDPLALSLAQEAVRLKLDHELEPAQRSFLYMPYMHSESRIIHLQAVQLFEMLGNSVNLDFERKHQVIIERFGRYPHRNQILQRQSSVEEIEFLKQPDSSF